MSASLMWEPKNRKAQSLPYELKAVLFKEGSSGRQTFSDASGEYLRGLRDAGVKGAQELLDAIDKYEEVELWLEY